MKALTIWQPYASLIAADLKRYETRSWPTRYRGPIAIHSGLRPMRWILKHGKEEALDVAIEAFGTDGLLQLPVGKIVAVGYVTGCFKMTQEFIDSVSEKERAAGDWKVGNYAWKLENVRPVDPIDAVGRQGLWDVELCQACAGDTARLRCAGCDGLSEFQQKGQPVRCCFCGGLIRPKEGHNPAPVRNDGVCCLNCNMTIVVPARMKETEGGKEG